MNATILVVCYKSKTLSNGEHPLMLRIIKNRKISYKSLKISVDAKYWDFEKSELKSNCQTKINKIILQQAILCENCIFLSTFAEYRGVF